MVLRQHDPTVGNYLAGIKGQASQIPRMHVLDLSVFPCMSKRHIQKCRESGGRRVMPETRKWSPHMFKLTGLQTKLSKQKAITNFLAQVGESIVGSETISNLTKLVSNERISAPNK
jgi:hypothetical protein